VVQAGANTSMIFVPAPSAADAMMEAASAGIQLIICITEGISILEMAKVKRFIKDKDCCLIGPNCPGVITPGIGKVGIMPGYIHKPGNVGVISRSGTLTYETVWQLTQLGIGQSTCVGIGGDPIIGMSFIDILQRFQMDTLTKAVVMIGEIGGDMEEQTASFIQKGGFDKPMVAFVAGQTAPPGKRMGHAGAIIQQGSGTAQNKMDILRRAGVHVVVSPADIGKTMVHVLQEHDLQPRR